MKTLPLVFCLLLAANAAILAWIWLERTLVAMNSAPESQSQSSARGSSECMALGPLDAHDAAEALAERIRRDGGEAVVRTREILSRPDYVVYVEPSTSRDLAMQTLRELRNQRINGHVISDGTLANAVSVGVFGLPAPAEVHRQRVADLGYEVGVARMERRRAVYSVYMDAPPLELPEGMRLGPCEEH